MIAWGMAVVWVLWRLLVREGAVSIPRDLIRILVLPYLLILVAMPGALFHPLADAGKDLWYFLNPILYIAFGYFLFEQIRQWERFTQPFIIVGLIASTYSAYNIYNHRQLLLASDSIEGYRQVAGFGFGQAAIPIVLLLLFKRAGLPPGYFDRFRAIRAGLYILGSAAILLSLSRTLIVVLASGFLLSVHYRQLSRKLLANGGIRIIVLVLLVAAGASLKNSSVNIADTFLEKTLHSTSEVEVEHYDTFQQINDNWRGFEAYRALHTFEDFTSGEKLIGGGFGTDIDLGFAMALSPTESLQLIPITHNGYMYLLVKTGVAGLCLFAAFILQITSRGWITTRSRDPILVFTGYLLLWTAVDFVMTQGVITGIYNKSALAPNLLLLGAAYATLRQQQQLATE